jgi:hypothetical protein
MQNDNVVFELLVGKQRPESDFAQNAANLLRLLLEEKEPTPSAAEIAVCMITATCMSQKGTVDDACSYAALFQALLIAWPQSELMAAIDNQVGAEAVSCRQGLTFLRGYLLAQLAAGSFFAKEKKLEKDIGEMYVKHIAETLIYLLRWRHRDISHGKGEIYLGKLSNEVSIFLNWFNGGHIFTLFCKLYKEHSKSDSSLGSRLREDGDCIDMKILDEFIHKRFNRLSRFDRMEMMSS